MVAGVQDKNWSYDKDEGRESRIISLCHQAVDNDTEAAIPTRPSHTHKSILPRDTLAFTPQQSSCRLIFRFFLSTNIFDCGGIFERSLTRITKG